MSEKKYYTPVLKPGDHLLRSTDNPNRVRGLSRDENNDNPDIPEWEEVQLPERTEDVDELFDFLGRYIVAPVVGALVDAAFRGAERVIQRKIVPWWKSTGKPRLKSEIKAIPSRIKSIGTRRKKAAQLLEAAVLESANDTQEQNHLQLEEAFQQLHFVMDSEEAKQHAAKLVFHLLGLANEIRILSNAKICNETGNEQEQLERQHTAEQLLTSEVAVLLDGLLSSDSVELDLETTKRIFGMMGGGVRLNGEYIPVEHEKLIEAIHNTAPIGLTPVEQTGNTEQE